ncbi:MAG TPA: zf-HC2 domain-containing protein [Pyrinomonadaceae bacterium]|jgi:predicted anti-sigma-YlaC factor YlaD
MANKKTLDCAESLLQLSEYRDKALDENYYALVKEHLEKCPPCMVIYKDIDLIVMSAPVITNEDGIAFPDENVIWQRMRITKLTIN